MEAYISVAVVFGIWMLLVFIESNRGSHIKVDKEADEVFSAILECELAEDYSRTNSKPGEVNPNTSAKKRKRQRKRTKRS